MIEAIRLDEELVLKTSAGKTVESSSLSASAEQPEFVIFGIVSQIYFDTDVISYHSLFFDADSDDLYKVGSEIAMIWPDPDFAPQSSTGMRFNALLEWRGKRYKCFAKYLMTRETSVCWRLSQLKKVR